MMQELFLKLTLPDWLFFIFFLLIIVLAYFYYWRTLPPLSRFRQAFLAFLRAGTLAILLFIVSEPVLQFVRQYQEKPIVAFLFDNSASMKIRDSYGLRGDSLKAVLNAMEAFRKNDSLEIAQFHFATGFAPLADDSLTFAEDGTNISLALQSVEDSLAKANLQAVVLVSDGIYNQGNSPVQVAREMDVPIYTVLVGDTTPPADIIVQRVQTNSVTYVGQELPIEVVFKQNGYDGKQAILTVNQGRKELGRKVVTLGRSGFEQKEVFTIVPDRPGDVLYQVRFAPLEGEVTEKNNQKSVPVKVLKSRLQVAVFSGAPDFDRHFLYFLGQSLEDFQFTFYTEKAPGQYYEADFRTLALDSVDVFIFHGFPTTMTDRGQFSRIMQTIRTRKLPVFWLLNRNNSNRLLGDYPDLLPFELASRSGPMENISVRLTRGGLTHPVTRLADVEGDVALLWKNVPPISILTGVQPRKGNFLLLEGVSAGEALDARTSVWPVLFSFRVQEIKQLVLNAANVGFWHFQLQEDPLRDQLMRNFLFRSIRWLANREDVNQVQIKPSRQIYNEGEPIYFSGQVYDEFYQPVSDATVSIELRQDTLVVRDEFIAQGDGFYEQRFTGLSQGEILYQIVARRQNQQLGMVKGKIVVQPFNLEFQEIPANGSLMRKLAEVSGGRAFTPREFIRQFPTLKFENRQRLATSEKFLWNLTAWLPVLILFLSLEWFFRKRWGLL